MENNKLKVSNFFIFAGAIFILFLIAGAYILGTQNAKPIPFLQNSPASQASGSKVKKIQDWNWKAYENSNLGFSLRYPSDLYLTEVGNDIYFTFNPKPSSGWGPGPLTMIQVSKKGDWLNKAFNALFAAKKDDDVVEAQNAVYVKALKIRNFKIGGLDAVEYIHDGITPPKGNLGRGPVGYSHVILIKKNDSEFLELRNTSMEVEETKLRDEIFNKMVDALIVFPLKKPVRDIMVFNISYNLPLGWKTIVDKLGRLEAGYDPEKYSAKASGNLIDLSDKWILEDGKSRRLGWNKYFYLTSYSGASRHSELYKVLGVSEDETNWKGKEYSEREYLYNGWNCLVLSGISISQFPAAFAYCPVSKKEAAVLAFDSTDWAKIEEQISTIKLLK